MTNQKSTKRTLFASVVSLLLCITMLIGATFAWFTDDVKNTGNRLIAGNLEVDLVMDIEKDGNYTSIAGGRGDIFSEDGNGINWEPGKTEIVYLGIRNLGSLALKYNVLLDIVEDSAKSLIGSLEYAIIDGAKASDLTSATKWSQIKDAAAAENKGDIEAGQFTAAENGVLDEIVKGVDDETDYFALAVHMKEDAGNEYQEGSIQIDVLVSATQKDAESDSFGTEYDKALTPPDRDGNIITVTDDGLEIYYLENGEVYLYDAQEYAESSAITLPEGITQLGDYSFTHSEVIKEVTLPSTVTSLGRAFDTSKVEKVTLNEGLEQIDSRAFKETKALEEVVIPSTVKVIADNAFQKSWLKEITIPATVETIGEASFGSSKIEKVTFMGNTSIQGYAFRGCPQLREVYLYGDDVTFIPSTLNGRNSMWFCNGESNNPNTSNITFYVANETVKERVLTAMGAERNNTTVIIMNP